MKNCTLIFLEKSECLATRTEWLPGDSLSLTRLIYIYIIYMSIKSVISIYIHTYILYIYVQHTYICCFHILAIVNSTSMIVVHVSFQINVLIFYG